MKRWVFWVLAVALLLGIVPLVTNASTASDVQSEYEIAKAERDAAQTARDEAKAAHEAAEQAVQEAKAVRDEAQRVLDDLKARRVTGRKRREAKAALDAAVADLRAKRAVRAEALATLRAAQEALRLAQEAFENTTAGGTIVARKEARLAWEAAVDALVIADAEATAARAATAEANQLRQDKRAECREAKGVMDTLQAHVDSYSHQLTLAENEAATLNDSLETAIAERDAAKEAYESILAEANGVHSEYVNGFKDTYVAKNQAVIDLENKLAVAETKVADLKETLTINENQLADSQATHTTCQTDYDNLLATYRDLKADRDVKNETAVTAAAAVEQTRADYDYYIQRTEHSAAKVIGLTEENEAHEELIADVYMGCLAFRELGSEESPLPGAPYEPGHQDYYDRNLSSTFTTSIPGEAFCVPSGLLYIDHCTSPDAGSTEQMDRSKVTIWKDSADYYVLASTPGKSQAIWLGSSINSSTTESVANAGTGTEYIYLKYIGGGRYDVFLQYGAAEGYIEIYSDGVYQAGRGALSGDEARFYSEYVGPELISRIQRIANGEVWDEFIPECTEGAATASVYCEYNSQTVGCSQ